MQTEMPVAEPPAGILDRAAQGEADAFAELVRRHQRLVFSVAWHFFNDRMRAEDLAQEVFLQLFQKLRDIQSESHLVFWLRQVTIRKCIDHTRRLQRHREVALESVVSPDVEMPGPDSLEREQLRRLVAALPVKLRAVVTLRYQEDMPPGEIANLLGCPVNSVKSRLQRALALLRERMET